MRKHTQHEHSTLSTKMRATCRLADVAIVLLALTRAFVASAAQAADTIPGAPAGVMLSGVACAAGQVLNDAEALGGKATTSGGEYESLVQAKLPETGESFTVWVHRKGGPIQLKTIVKGAQHEKVWNWGKTDPVNRNT
jgi:Ni,Fe-hydrogenase III small subunit